MRALITLLLLVPAGLAAAGPAGQTPGEPVSPNSLKIIVLEGQNGVNSTLTMTATTPVVEVRDANDMPVEGAEVIFELPASGPGGAFPGGRKSFTATTNYRGQAQAPFEMNSEVGRFDIQVTARADNRAGRVTISQTTVAKLASDYRQKRPWHRSWKFWAIAGGAAAAAVAVILVTGDGSPETGTITITPGTPTFGGPR